MVKQNFVLCLKNPMLPKPLVMVRSEDACQCDWGVELLRSHKQLISLGFSCVLEAFRQRRYRRMPYLIDVQTAKRLSVGRPRSEFKTGHEPWQIVEILGRNISQDSRRWLTAFTKIESLDFPENMVAQNIMDGLAAAWATIETELEQKGEAKRFYEIEVPIYNIFLKTELNGIHVDQTKLRELLDVLQRQRYGSYKTLELKHGFVSQRIKPQMGFSDIQDFVQLPYDDADFDGDFWRQADLFAEHEDFLKHLVTAHRSKGDADALLRYSVDSRDRVYPRFDVMGTVTGRILMPSPGIQYLKKTSRSVFCPAKGRVFLYADFDQFEPGIVASLSGDERLTELYNAGDIYENLSRVLFGDATERKLAKTIFLAYLYGMTRERLVSFVRKTSRKETAGDYVRSFFQQFRQLNHWKESLCEGAKKDGFAETCFGNKRYISGNANLSAKEKRWIPNQVVQGTASLIFKRSLIALHTELKGRVAFLIPMHDAILLEVSDEDNEEARSVVKEVFCREFVHVCPGIQPGVSFEDFATG
jgi:DNA polymerase I-like protein with 3'-5' exonuclease and polymerase domains